MKKDIKESVVATPTSTNQTTQSKPQSKPQNGGVNINVSKKELGDSSVQQNISKIKNANINVVESGVSGRLKYVSEVKDTKTGKISQPFTIKGKKYQMVRALSPSKQKVMAVYCIDEMDEEGSNKIYDLKEFEDTIAKESITETNNEPTGDKEKSNASFVGYKHFIVNEKTGKARKFKTIEDLAKAKMNEGEKYMGLKDFKKFVDESLFGKRPIKEDDVNTPQPNTPQPNTPQPNTPQPNTPQPNTPQEENAGVMRLFKLIDKVVPPDAYENIKQNPIAQQQAIIGFTEKIGVPKTKLNDIISTLKNLSAIKQNSPTQPNK